MTELSTSPLISGEHKCKIEEVKVGMLIETRQATTVLILSTKAAPCYLYSYGMIGDASNKFTVGEEVVAEFEIVEEVGRPAYTVVRAIKL